MKQLTLPLSLLLLLIAGLAQANPSLIPSPPNLAASGYVLMDYHSGQIIAQSNAGQRLEPASLTKMMTAYTVFNELRAGHINLSDQVRVSEKAWRMTGSRMFIEAGSSVSVEELLKGMIIQSGNDASVALAEHVAGSEEAFVTLMNAHATRLGLEHTQFTNSTGLPDPNLYTTPIEMARLASALIHEFPQYYPWYSERSYTYNNIRQSNRNLLLFRDDSVDGLKTGHTSAAGYCLVASAQRNEMRLISVIMGTSSERARAQESEKLLNYGFRFFETHRLYAAREPLSQMRIWKAETEQLPLGLAEELFVTVPRGQYGDLKASMRLDQTISAPISQHQQLGAVEIRLGNELLAERPLIALQDVAKGGLWQQLKDHVLLMFQ
ncbi:MAG: D-alanyl-D-alanine carboxypeptidase [Chromatiales bacterium]|nr:D-alanyl-D-alanine carboxypeptidase [Gammaproteobacteria bacterium]MBW6476558.1 D-alanyl-D-alanine carboxypeptidase [Chromatiales bacterium]